MGVRAGGNPPSEDSKPRAQSPRRRRRSRSRSSKPGRRRADSATASSISSRWGTPRSAERGSSPVGAGRRMSRPSQGRRAAGPPPSGSRSPERSPCGRTMGRSPSSTPAKSPTSPRAPTRGSSGTGPWGRSTSRAWWTTPRRAPRGRRLPRLPSSGADRSRLPDRGPVPLPQQRARPRRAARAPDAGAGTAPGAGIPTTGEFLEQTTRPSSPAPGTELPGARLRIVQARGRRRRLPPPLGDPRGSPLAHLGPREGPGRVAPTAMRPRARPRGAVRDDRN